MLELLGPRENDDAWHGGCIALAELGRFILHNYCDVMIILSYL